MSAGSACGTTSTAGLQPALYWRPNSESLRNAEVSQHCPRNYPHGTTRGLLCVGYRAGVKVFILGSARSPLCRLQTEKASCTEFRLRVTCVDKGSSGSIWAQCTPGQQRPPFGGSVAGLPRRVLALDHERQVEAHRRADLSGWNQRKRFSECCPRCDVLAPRARRSSLHRNGSLQFTS